MKKWFKRKKITHFNAYACVTNTDFSDGINEVTAGLYRVVEDKASGGTHALRNVKYSHSVEGGLHYISATGDVEIKG